MTSIEQNLFDLYTSWSGSKPASVTKLPGSGSYRSYFRILGPGCSAIGAHNADTRENDAFISFSEHFQKEGLPVPGILAKDLKNKIYLVSDLGDLTLFQLLTEKRSQGSSSDHDPGHPVQGSAIPQEIVEIYKKALDWLPLFQVRAGKGLDYKVCYPRTAFDRQSMMWDLNYFKYYFLRLARIPFDEQALEDDFTALCDLLLQADDDFFLYRDFQSRNIMVMDGNPWFIDYQGGRKGALQYDLASLLYDGKADLPQQLRDELLSHYLSKLGEVYHVDHEKFLNFYHAFVLIRILQALGAYGFRGYYEKKVHFLKSIPYALKNLHRLRDDNTIDFGLRTLMSAIDTMIADPGLYNQELIEITDRNKNIDNKISLNNDAGLLKDSFTVTIYSFSYKKSVPEDENGNGGGFVFDCRALPNPGRSDEYRLLTGKDGPVIDLLGNDPAVISFMDKVISLIDQSVKNYMGRGFEHLMVAFGCTGGQHRSVYCAGKLAEYLKLNYDISIKVIHTGLEIN